MAALAWATPTRRAMRWRPLAAVTTGIGAAVLALWAAGAPPIADPPVAMVVALLVAAAALALDDPAHALVAAVPIGFGRRVAHRVAWLVPATFAGLVSVGWVASRADMVSEPGRILATAAALGSVAVATHMLVARRRPDLAASVAAVVPAGWVVTGSSPSGIASVETLSRLWLDHPWTVCACASTLAVIAARRS